MPKFSINMWVVFFWSIFGVLIAVFSSIPLPATVSPAAAAAFSAWSIYIMKIYLGINTGVIGLSGAQTGPLVGIFSSSQSSQSSPKIPPVAVIAALMITGFLLLAPGHAEAATRRALPVPSIRAKASPIQITNDVLAKVSAAVAALKAKGVTDITAADALASAIDPATNQMKDPIAHACYPAEVAFIKALPELQSSLTGLGPVQIFEQKRLVVLFVNAGIPTSIQVGCSALLQDEAINFAKIAALAGVSVVLPAGGLALPVLPML